MASSLFITLAMMPAPAQAAPALSTSPEQQIAAAERATDLANSLGSDVTAGTYLDQATGQMVITVTDTATAEAVRAAGGVAKLVTRSGADLERVTNALSAAPTVTGTAWAVDPVTNQVVVSLDSTVDATERAQIESVTRQFGQAVRIEHTPGVFDLMISGGDAIYGGNSRCSLGFNVRTGSGTQYFVTAGHCTNIASTWYANASHSQVLGPRAATSFPGNDYGVVRYSSGISRPGVVNLYNGSTRDITGAANAFVGQSVLRSGSTTGLRSGSVTALNATVNYPQGTVFGLIRTTVCAEGGDSGGSLFAGNTALGLTSGGSGNCTFGGTTFFQPVTEVLNRYGLSVY